MSYLSNFPLEAFKKEKEYLVKCKNALDNFELDLNCTDLEKLIRPWFRLLILCVDQYRLLSSGHFCRPSFYQQAKKNGLIYEFKGQRSSFLFRYEGERNYYDE
jgi:hypothetical protein